MNDELIPSTLVSVIPKNTNENYTPDLNKEDLVITKEDLEQIKGLRLDNNQLTDVKCLEKLTQLRTVNLSGNQLTSLKGLEKLTQLTYLALYNNPTLTKAQIDQLQKALPKCEINRIGMPEPTLIPPRKTP